MALFKCCSFFYVSTVIALTMMTMAMTGPVQQAAAQETNLSSQSPKKKTWAMLPRPTKYLPFLAMSSRTQKNLLSIGFRNRQSKSCEFLRRRLTSTLLLPSMPKANDKDANSINNDQFPTMARGGSQVKVKKEKSTKRSKSKEDRKNKRPCAISSPKPFLSSKSIGELTLTEVGKAFDYAVQCTQKDFDRSRFEQGLPARVKSMFTAMDNVAATSRGPDVRAATTVDRVHHRLHMPSGDIDTFQFCAAARVLSEWRMVRQVPEGYKKFASSMRMGNNDVVQNIGKMEAAAHDYIDDQKEHQAGLPDPKPVHSPTLREMLQFEVEMGYHPSLPKLKEVSGAMGLLWVRRQLQFQTSSFTNLCRIPKKFSGPTEALAATYDQVYSKFHRGITQKIFNYSFREGPEIHEIYKMMNPRRLKEVKESLDRIEAAKPGTAQNRQMNIPKAALSDTESSSDDADVIPGHANIPEDPLERQIWQEMEADAHHHIQEFVKSIQPVLDDLENLFGEFNMNDPKRA